MSRVNACQTNGRKKFATGTMSRIACCFASIGFSMPLLAQDNNAASFKLGEADVTPQVRFDYVSNSNAFLTPDNETETTGFIVSPQIEYVATRRLLALTLGYSGAFASLSESDLDYADQELYAGLAVDFATRHRLTSNLSVASQHQELGVGLTLGADEDQDQVELVNTLLDTRYTFGARNARGNIIAVLLLNDISYQNRSDITDGRDYTLVAPFARFAYRIGGGTRAFIGARFNSFDFDDDIRDRSEIVGSLGLTFDGTGRTGGEARIGVSSVTFDDDTVGDETLLSAEIDVFYAPSSISRFDLQVSRELDNTDSAVVGGGLGSDDINDSIDFTWTYDWSAFITTRALLSADLRQRDCPVTGTDTTSAGFEIGLNPRRWIELGVGYEYTTRGDDECPVDAGEPLDLEFDRQLISLFVRATL